MLTVKAQRFEVASAWTADTGGAVHLLGDRILLIYRSVDPTPPGAPVPACEFPVELTYRIAGLARRDYRFVLVDRRALELLGGGAALLLPLLGWLALRKFRRWRGARGD